MQFPYLQIGKVGSGEIQLPAQGDRARKKKN